MIFVSPTHTHTCTHTYTHIHTHPHPHPHPHPHKHTHKFLPQLPQHCLRKQSNTHSHTHPHPHPHPHPHIYLPQLPQHSLRKQSLSRRHQVSSSPFLFQTVKYWKLTFVFQQCIKIFFPKKVSVQKHFLKYNVNFVFTSLIFFLTMSPFARMRYCYGVVLVSRIDKIIGPFCKRALYKRRYSAKETYNSIDPTDRSHPICLVI